MDDPVINIELDALSLEYKRDYGTAFGYLNVADIINNPAACSEFSVFGLSFAEEALSFLKADTRF